MALDAFRNIWRIGDIRRRILNTILLLAIYRLGSHIPAPGVNIGVLSAYFERMSGSVLGLFDLFVGGNLSRATIFALGIMPYISASIILQILGATIPYYQRLSQEGEEGRRKMTQHIRYLTVGIAAFNSISFAIFLQNLSVNGVPVLPNPSFFVKFSIVITMTAGTIFLMWLGELVTENGIGNGVSLLIMFSILARGPAQVIQLLRSIKAGTLSLIASIIFAVVAVLIIAAVVLVTQAQRRIPVQYAKRVKGRKIYGGQATHLPLNVNTAGVIPIIFAQSALMILPTFAGFFRGQAWADWLVNIFSPSGFLYNFLFVLLIVVFAYVYTAIVINPQELASNLKKYGGFIPGVRPGRATAEHIDRVLSRITLPGALFFAFVAIVPIFFAVKWNFPFYFGGTSIIIVVGVALDTASQLESHLLMRHYEGFMKTGRIRGRRR
ncbi:MAG: preprotein translocase subunit SecY [candidate division WOR-3 bacterium]